MITHEQYAFLDAEACRSSVSVAELIRRAIDTVYAPLGPRPRSGDLAHARPKGGRAARPSGLARPVSDFAVPVVDGVAEAKELVRWEDADLVRVGIDRGAGVTLVREHRDAQVLVGVVR